MDTVIYQQEGATPHCSNAEVPKVRPVGRIYAALVGLITYLRYIAYDHRRNFVVKCGGTTCCETNTVLGSMQK